MKPPFPFHPPLFAIYPALSLYSANVALISWRDALVPMLLAAGGGIVLWAIASLAFRDLQRGAAVTSVVTICFFSFELLSQTWDQLVLGDVAGTPDRAPIWLWIILLVALAFLAGWKSKATPKIATFLNIVSGLLVLFSMGTVAMAHWGIRSEIAKRSADRETSPGNADRRPDVFYIILDGYGRTDTFERLYGFTDSSFIEGLEAAGFYVAKDARSNYSQTELSLASSLNLAPVQELVDPSGDMIRLRAVLDQQIDDSRVAREFKERGYRYVAITTGFPALTFETADVRMERDSGASLYRNALLNKTPFPPSDEEVTSQFALRRKFLTAGFNALRELSRPSTTPRFVVVHILAPHPPFVFGPNGEELRPKGSFGLWDGSHYDEMAGTDDDYKKGYRDQATYISKVMLETIAPFPKTGPGAPIILIQGDHGPKAKLDHGSLDKTDVNEVFPILAAYRVPDDIRKSLYPGITPVNSFRIILSTLFGDDLPKLPDRSYYSTWEKPAAFTDITAKLAPRKLELQE